MDKDKKNRTAAGSGEVSRRGFLRAGVTGALAAGTMGPSALAGSTQIESPPPRLTNADYTTLGRTGVRASRVGAGLSLNAEALIYSREMGINYFDTAEKYMNGQHEEMVGQAIQGHRDKMFVNAKFQDGMQNELTATADEIVERAYRSMERLKTGYIDCMMIHNVQHPRALSNPALHDAFRRLKALGKVRFLGASTHDPRLYEIITRAVELNHFDILLVSYNPTNAGDLYGTAGWPGMLEVLRDARHKGTAVSTMKIIVGAQAAGAVTGVGPEGLDPSDIKGRGMYLEARTAATRWVLSNPDVNVVQFTMTGPEVVHAAVRGATSLFRGEDRRLVESYTARNSESFCPVPCPAPCQDACPVTVSIADILRYRMYYETYGLQKQALLEYASLSPGNQATACLTCPTTACASACPNGIDVKGRMLESRKLLTL